MENKQSNISFFVDDTTNRVYTDYDGNVSMVRKQELSGNINRVSSLVYNPNIVKKAMSKIAPKISVTLIPISFSNLRAMGAINIREFKVVKSKDHAVLETITMEGKEVTSFIPFDGVCTTAPANVLRAAYLPQGEIELTIAVDSLAMGSLYKTYSLKIGESLKIDSTSMKDVTTKISPEIEEALTKLTDNQKLVLHIVHELTQRNKSGAIPAKQVRYKLLAAKVPKVSTGSLVATVAKRNLITGYPSNYVMMTEKGRSLYEHLKRVGDNAISVDIDSLQCENKTALMKQPMAA